MTQSSLVELVKDAFGSVSKGQLPAGPILKALINKGLGYGVLAGACITRVPQVSFV